MRKVSIHAPAWGATLEYADTSGWLYVSIHAPAWGATVTSSISQYNWGRFNPRARVGRDPYEMMYADQCRWCFNPRARVGRDGLKEKYSLHSLVSIHAPAWGATRTQLIR